MKKILLFLTSMLVGAAAFAQSFTAEWPKPLVPEFTNFAVEDTLYLWNVGAGGFYINYQKSNGAPTYGTRASVDGTIGTKVIFTRTNPDKNVTEDWSDMPNAYLLVSYVTKFKEYHCSFAEDADTEEARIFTDNNKNPNRYWIIEPSGKYFKIVGDKETNTNAPGRSLGAIDTELGWLVSHSGITSDVPFFYDEWAAVSKETYEAWDCEENKKVYEYYHASEALKTAILGAEAAGIAKADLAEYYAVYNNLNSTEEELKQATLAAVDKGRWNEIKEYFDNIVVGEKNDVSGVFINNDFDQGDKRNMIPENTKGWDITFVSGKNATNIGYNYDMGTTLITHPITKEEVPGLINEYENEEGDMVVAFLSKFIEAWRDAKEPLGIGSITQTIPGLPKGKYVLAVDANACLQSNAKDVDNVQLFAKASLTGKEYFTPVSTPDEKNRPKHFEFDFIHGGGSMTLGLRTTDKEKATNPANWIAMDNLKLYYYGDEGVDPDQYQLQLLIKDLITKQDPEEMEEVKAFSGAKTSYTTALTTAENIDKNGGDYVQAKTDLQAAYDTLQASIQDYKTFAAFLERADERLLDFEGTAYEESVGGPLADEIGKWQDAYNEEEYDKKDIESLEESLVKIVADHFPTTLEVGDDLTPFIANANFNSGFYGWSYKDNQPVWGGNKDKESGCAEVFHKKFSMYQTYKNLPAGVYQFRTQLFERDDNEKGIETVLYATVGGKEQSVSAPNIQDYSTEEKLFDNDVSYEDRWIPNSMNGANHHFAHTTEGNDLPDYTTTLNIVLTETSDVEFGVKCTSDGDWVIFDNFQLVYLGEDLSVYLIPVNDKLEELNKFVTNNEDNIGSDVKDNLETLTAGVANLQTKDECVAYIETIEKAITYAHKSAELYPQAEDIVNQLDTAKDEEDANQAAAAEASDYLETIADNLSNRELTVAELEAVIEKASDLMGELKVPANYSTASDGNPINMTQVITNPSFEDGLNGWAYYQSSETKAAENSKDQYKIDIADGSYVFNTWNGSVPEGGFYVSQVLKSLPAGTYELQAILASDKGNVIDLTANGEGMPFEMVGAKEKGQESSIIFKLEEKGDVTIKASSMSWFKADNFRLTYYGNESEKEVTGIEETEIANAANGNAPMYNLAGQQVGKDYKGIVIVNGKKLYIK